MVASSEEYSMDISTRGLDPVGSSSAGVWYSNQRSKTNEKEKDGTTVIATTYATIEALFRSFCRKLSAMKAARSDVSLFDLASELWLTKEYEIFLYY